MESWDNLINAELEIASKKKVVKFLHFELMLTFSRADSVTND